MMKKINNQAKNLDNKLDSNLDYDKIINELKEEVAYHLAGWQRAQADYQNLKKEFDSNRIDSIKFANKNLIENLIPVFDNFAIAIKHLPSELNNDNWVQGIIFIYKQLQDILIAEGVEIISPNKGEIFDPNIHEAVDSQKSEQELDSNTVIEVLQEGYKLNGVLIRSARVKVSL
jgi:molecular chaperone GrpE